MADVVLFGVGQFAEVAKVYLDWEGSHRIVAFTVTKEYLKNETKDGVPVVAWETLESTHPPGQVSLFCPVSYRGVNQFRKEKFLEGRLRGYEFISFIHPKAHYYGTPVGQNCFILEANVIQPYVTICDNCILWSGNHIGHHTCIRSHVFLASHVVVSGSVDVGERCFLGVNSTLRDNIRIGEGCVIGAGALVLSDLPEFSVVGGTKSEISRVKSFQLRSI
jgi:sugar O-acyltransferase (sialic acid O-acetyltransferase NeuD family)